MNDADSEYIDCDGNLTSKEALCDDFVNNSGINELIFTIGISIYQEH